MGALDWLDGKAEVVEVPKHQGKALRDPFGNRVDRPEDSRWARCVNKAAKYARDFYNQSRIKGLRHYGFCGECGENNFEKRYVVVNQDGKATGKTWPWLRRQGWPQGYRVVCRGCYGKQGVEGVEERVGYGGREDGQLTLWPE